jgi:hypothetical protein
MSNLTDPALPNPMADRYFIYIYSAVATKARLTGLGYSRDVTLAAGEMASVDLTDPAAPAPSPMVVERGAVSASTFRLESDDPVMVYCYMATKFGAEAWTPLPVNAWGTQYYAAGIPAEVGADVMAQGAAAFGYVAKMFPAEITVIAADSNTTISMTPAGRVLNAAWRTTVVLHANQAYQLQSYVDTANPDSQQPEFAGTFIQSNKPIAVLSGNTRAQGVDKGPGLAKNSFKNMMIEALAPVEQHGRQFVYMPTLDGNQITGAPGENIEAKRQEELVRVYGTNKQNKQTTLFHSDPATGALIKEKITPPGKLGYFHQAVTVPEAVYYRTDSAAEAFMNSTGVVQYAGSIIDSGGKIGARYNGWGGYMTELAPREQWVNFTPFVTPAYPSSMKHFINVVTDTLSAVKIVWGSGTGQPNGLFPFTRRIKGTDLVWGTMGLPAGGDFYLRGSDTTVRFAGFVYGLNMGYEQYRPGATPATYEERLALSYGYPLAPSRRILAPGDSLQIDTVTDCRTLHIHLKALSEDPVGLRSVTLENPVNAKFVFVNPSNPNDLIAKVEAALDVVTIDPLQNASATVVITDRTGKNWRIPYSYRARRVDLTPTGKNGDDLDFGDVPLGVPVERDVTVINPLDSDVTIRDLKFLTGNQNFIIISPTVPPAITLKPGESIVIRIQFIATEKNKHYDDSLRIILGCAEVRIKLLAQEKPAAVDAPDIAGYGLGQNDPNPFHDATSIEFSIPRAGTVRLEIYDLLGRRVATLVDGTMQRGLHSATWTATGVPAGIYYYRLIGENWSGSREMIVR